jgi:adenylate cyclase
MPADDLKRKLTAILYTDVVGYSRLTGSDEEGTHRRVMQLLDNVSSQITAAGGTVLRYAGDAILAEFSSTVSAVKTAVSIQAALLNQNAELSDDQKVQIRIGINIGDVIEDRGEVFGDGVNLAARLESVAPEGGVCISAGVYEQIQGKLETEFTDDGLQQFKNINRPVGIYRWMPVSDTGVSVASNVKRNSEKPSIAVLALTNMSNDPNQDYIGDGITEDLITALSKIRSFKVISRESTFSYKGSSVDVRQIAKELGVGYVLEGSVRRSGDRVRATAQLIDAKTGHHVWAERYDREMKDIFDLQDEMVQIIAGALEPELNAFERELAVNKPPGNLDAWEQYQRALWFMWSFENDKVLQSMDMFKQAIEADPKFAPAHAYLAYSCYITVILGYVEDPKARLAEGLEAANQALQIDEKDAISYFAFARIRMMQGDHDASVAALRKSIQLNPCFAQSYHGLGFALTLSGELEKAKQTTQKAIEMSPQDPMLWAFHAVHSLTLLLNHEYKESLESANTCLRIPNCSGYWGHAIKAAALGNLDRIEEAESALLDAKNEKPDLSMAFLIENLPTKHADGLEPYLAGMRKSGLD